jgi:hypothetical protein
VHSFQAPSETGQSRQHFGAGIASTTARAARLFSLREDQMAQEKKLSPGKKLEKKVTLKKK